MVNYQYAYLIGDIILLIVWLILFYWRKDTRKEILIISFIFGIIGLLVDPVYAIDWWKVSTITNTMPGIESFLFGFATAGIASIIYSELSSKRLKIKRAQKREDKRKNINFLLLLLLGVLLFYGSFFLLHLNSLQSSLPTLLIPTLIIWIKRRDLIINSLTSGFLLMIISFTFYHVPEIIFPGWLGIVWNFNMLSGITIFKVVIEDLIWFFLSGMLIGPLYEYWQEAKLINKRK
jgi:hypothetical protein